MTDPTPSGPDSAALAEKICELVKLVALTYIIFLFAAYIIGFSLMRFSYCPLPDWHERDTPPPSISYGPPLLIKAHTKEELRRLKPVVRGAVHVCSDCSESFVCISGVADSLVSVDGKPCN